MTLQDVGYGSHGERIGYDLYPYTEDQVAAVRQSVIQWAFIDGLARKIDRAALAEVRARADAVAGYQLVYQVLGLDQDFINNLLQRRAGAK